MILTITVALWAYMFTGPWSDPGKVFGWLKSLIYKHARAIYLPAIGCPSCHAVWVMGIIQLCNYLKNGDFSLLAILAASFFALLFEDFHQIRDRWKNN